MAAYINIHAWHVFSEKSKNGEPTNKWDAEHLAKSLFNGLDGDKRIIGNTIIIPKFCKQGKALLQELSKNARIYKGFETY